jgi:hypothetical protein
LVVIWNYITKHEHMNIKHTTCLKLIASFFRVQLKKELFVNAADISHSHIDTLSFYLTIKER